MQYRVRIEPERALELGEGDQTLIPYGDEGGTLRPCGAKRVPSDASVVLRAMFRGDLVNDDGGRRTHEESMRHSAWKVSCIVIFCAEVIGLVLPVCRRPDAQV